MNIFEICLLVSSIISFTVGSKLFYENYKLILLTSDLLVVSIQLKKECIQLKEELFQLKEKYNLNKY